MFPASHNVENLFLRSRIFIVRGAFSKFEAVKLKRNINGPAVITSGSIELFYHLENGNRENSLSVIDQ